MSMQENPEEFENIESADTEEEKINTFRELIIGPEKKEMENQIKGMKELFTAMLVENKKDYHVQVDEIKNIFITVLEENKKSFQSQLQDLYVNLPEIINRSTKKIQAEEHIFLSEADKNGNQVEKLSRLDAVKEIILGGNMRDIEQRWQSLRALVKLNFEEGQNHLLQMAKDISNKLSEFEKRTSNDVSSLTNKLSQRLQQHDEKHADKKTIADGLKELAEKIK